MDRVICVEEHKRSTIGNHTNYKQGDDPAETIGSNFEILEKCQSKLDCLIFERSLFLFVTKTEQTESLDQPDTLIYLIISL